MKIIGYGSCLLSTHGWFLIGCLVLQNGLLATLSCLSFKYRTLCTCRHSSTANFREYVGVKYCAHFRSVHLYYGLLLRFACMLAGWQRFHSLTTSLLGGAGTRKSSESFAYFVTV